MSHLKNGKCAIFLEDTLIKDISGIIVFYYSQEIPKMDGNICENYYNELVQYKELWSKDGVNGMKLMH